MVACSAMQGYSEPVRQRTRQSTKPRKPSGIRYCAFADPVWASPNKSPVITAATHGRAAGGGSFQRRRAPNRKPRKKNSSAIGAITQTNTPVAIIAAVLLSTPSSLGSLSWPCRWNTAA